MSGALKQNKKKTGSKPNRDLTGKYSFYLFCSLRSFLSFSLALLKDLVMTPWSTWPPTPADTQSLPSRTRDKLQALIIAWKLEASWQFGSLWTKLTSMDQHAVITVHWLYHTRRVKSCFSVSTKHVTANQSDECLRNSHCTTWILG